MQEILEMQPEKVSREQLIGILCPNVPCLCWSAMPVLQPLPAVLMTPQCMQVMRYWAQMFGAAVRQRSVRQETTMARA